MADYSIKAGDTYPLLKATLKADGAPVDLTGATVTFNARDANSGTVIVSGASAAFETDGSDGKVKFTFSAAQTATAGTYQGEFVVDFGGGSIGTFPSASYIPFTITEDIA